MPVMLHLPYCLQKKKNTMYLRFGLKEFMRPVSKYGKRKNCIHVKPFQDFNHVPSYIE